MGLSPTLRRASNNSRMRVSTASGSLRVTMTIGFLDVGMAAGALYGLARRPAKRIPPCLTDGHHDDKTELTAATVAGVLGRSRSEPGTGLISIAKSWFGQDMS